MTSPGVEHTMADQPGHQRTESNDSQAMLVQNVANPTPNDDRRSRKRAASEDDDYDERAQEAKRFRVTADTPAAPTTAATTANSTGLPTAAAPTNESTFTTAAPAVVDNHDDVDNGPDEVPVNGSELDAASHVEGGGCDADEFSSSGDELEDEGPLPPFCEWNVVGPARLGYDQYADWVDRFGVAWRLDVVRAPRADAAPQHYAGFPTWVWTNLGHVAQGVKQDANYVDVYGNAWLLTLFQPTRPDGGRVPRSTTPAPGHAGPSNEANTRADEVRTAVAHAVLAPLTVPVKAPSYDPACCCCRGCCCCPLAAGDEAADATARAEPSPYRLVRLGPVHLGFDAHYIDRYGIAWRREPIPSPLSDVDEASSEEDEASEEEEVSSLDDEAQEAVPVNDKRSDADVEDNTDDEVFEDAGATDAEDDGSDAGVEYEDEDELEYAN